MLGMCACFGCGQLFAFDPDWVPSFQVDITTMRTPEMGADPARCHSEPVCPHCCRRLNPQRIANGLEPMPEHDTGEFPGPWGQYETTVENGNYVTRRLGPRGHQERER